MSAHDSETNHSAESASPSLPESSSLQALATERAWCREALLRVSRTFALNIRCLSGRMLESVRLGYLLCRAADALEDSWPGPPSEMAARFDELIAAVGGDRAAAERLATAAAALRPRADDLDLLARLPALLLVLESLDPADAQDVRLCVRTMAEGMKRYATRAAGRSGLEPYLEDDEELHDYCHVVAGCVGEMLTRLVSRSIEDDDARLAERRLALAPVVGEALQLTNILLDWPVDLRDGRCHVPRAWLARHGLVPRDLIGTSSEARELSLRLASLAHAAIDRVADYLDTIPTREHRYRLFCLLPTLWARASLDVALADPGFHATDLRPRLPRATVMLEAARGLAAHASHGATRQVLGRRVLATG
jgi:farnesyl-diphosphate farnesyltransferase